VRRILVGVDGSAESLRAVAWVAELAGELPGVEVVAVSVYGLDPTVSAYGAAYLTTDFWRQWRSEVAADLEGEWTKPLRDAGVKPTTLVEEGQAADVLLGLASEQGIDLIVVGSRGRGHLRGMFLGSVSHTLALRAHCPVVIVPHEEADSGSGAA
jgi:nucleotide-binding universal stress UspA family protein